VSLNKIGAALGGGLPFAVILCFFVAPILAESPQVDDSWQKNSHQWFEKVPPGGRVLVDNRYGNIYARFGGYEHEVEILATIQRIDTVLPELEVRRERSESGLDLIVRPAPAKETGGEPSSSASERNDRVDLVIFVPLDSALDARTADGRIEVKGVKGDLEAQSVKGDLWIRGVEGSVNAHTDRGQITATLETGVTAEPQKISTVTGEIEVHLWEDANTDVKVSTSGVISTDFSIEIEHRRFEEPGKIASARVGKGGPELVLTSKRGPIRLLRLPRHFKTDEQEKQNP
jgi:hypothetical protein